ncbi:MAG: multiheme c-type cytochrome [Pseudomonadota bacterium]
MISFRHLVAALAAVLTIGLPAAARAALSEDDQKCLACHAQEGMSKSFDNGESVALQVKGEQFSASVHAALGCAACHAGVDLKTHPGEARGFASARAYSVAQAGACRQCHDEAFKQYEESIHARRIAEGSPVAPTCSGCHGFHTVTPKAAYETCVGCHSAALREHGRWLPNAGLHHDVVSCAACHAPGAPRMLDLRLYDPAAKGWAAEKAGEPWFEKLAKSADPNGDGLDARELLELLKRINPDPAAPAKTFRGRVELRTNAEAHRLSAAAQALRACDNCHRAGAEPFQNVTVSVTGADGRPLRHAARKEVLGAALAVAALPEFYAIGGTRSTLLDVLFLLALAGGIAFPVGHLAARWVVRKLRG